MQTAGGSLGMEVRGMEVRGLAVRGLEGADAGEQDTSG